MNDNASVKLVSYEEFVRKTYGSVKSQNSIICTFDAHSPDGLTFTALSQGEMLTNRQIRVINYVRKIYNYPSHDYNRQKNLQGLSFVFQGDDRPNDAVSLSWQTRVDFNNVLLLPDFYYIDNNGYRSFIVESGNDWASREPIVFWRGATTGYPGVLTMDTLPKLARFKLCELGQSLSEIVDFGITNVVQAKTQEDKLQIEKYLAERHLLKARVAMEKYENYKYFIDLDGNGNSWELVKKLRLGACMLRVDSPWILWHFPAIKPWVHYVPVKADFSDLVLKIHWCLRHDEEARGIGYRARQFALSIDFEEEMRISATAMQNFSYLSEEIMPLAKVIKA